MKRPDLRRLRPSRRLLSRAAVVLAALVLVPVVVAAGMLRAAYAGAPAKDAVTRGRDALWLGHAWVDGRHTAADLAQLEQRVAGTGIRDLYLHAGPLEHDGTLPARDYAGARQLIDAVHRDLPGVRVQAWLGDVVVREGGGGLRLDAPATRDAVTESARQVLRAGFDGVHLDVEPVRTGDTGYLALLDSLRAAVRSGGGVLSVAAQQIDPLPSMHRAAQTLGSPKWWSQHYFGQVARRVDQIAVMSYDTALPWESLYGGYVARQTALALQVTPRTTDLLMGLPFYHSDNLGHNSTAETADAALRGARLGLTRQDRGRQAFGVALYVDFAATADDWRAYREGWGARE
ncbi:glycoside hydrolase family 18 protein [Streptomyces morookaense]|uniref:Glycoside hydrolase family 18 protein n=1 Tax=Streptomyces morookaense TaxID=1970 RepID=A0A7Y7E7G0_STRMO|nr:glycoside hydrolase family 18 protein [Streptomyces morookaense]NVK78344.1 glycoside hydrolase family 18 protein [Streptomyces morookaense]GHF49508.1 membrane protein [Streptomyces morookaense]